MVAASPRRRILWISTVASMVSAMSLSGTAGSTPKTVLRQPSGRDASNGLTGTLRSDLRRMRPARDSSKATSAAMMLRRLLILTFRTSGRE
ncbi:hypothetical protein V5799_024844 [Amblyomma americanum]|uniref:Secreted protein n=1 Tax=Amblyomma americanum TaxID=6943 RepID=A0AAQ4EAX6_AMBAM